MTEREGFRFKMLLWRSGNKNGSNKKASTRAIIFLILIFKLRRLNFYQLYSHIYTFFNGKYNDFYLVTT